MVKDIIEKIDLIPVFKPVNKRVSEALSKGKVKGDDFYEIVKTDPALSLLMLRSANSKIDGVDNAVSSIKLAINLLGAEKILMLNSSIKMLSENDMPGSSYVTTSNFWRHSLTVAYISEAIAKHIKRFKPINPDNLFCAGLFHDLGIISFIYTQPDKLDSTIEQSIKESRALHKFEDDYKHGEIGAEMLRCWNIPEKIYGPVWYHHDPSNTGKYELSAAIIHVADVTAQLIGMPLFDKETVPEVDKKALETIGLSPERLNVIARDSMEKVIALEKEFKLK